MISKPSHILAQFELVYHLMISKFGKCDLKYLSKNHFRLPAHTRSVSNKYF